MKLDLSITKPRVLLLFVLFAFTNFVGILSSHYIIIVDFFCILSLLIALHFRKFSVFSLCMIGYFCFFLMSWWSCAHYENQSLLSTITTAEVYSFFPVLSFFLFKRLRVGLKDILWGLNVYYVVVFLCFIFQLLLFPRQIFHTPTFIQDEGRFTMSGQIVVYFLFFYWYYKFLKTDKLKFALYMLPALIMLVVAGFRTQIAVFGLVMFIMLIHIKKIFALKYIFLVIPVVCALYFTSPVQNTINKIAERQENATMSNDNYIRVLQFNYFTKEHFKSPIERFFGSGIPNPTTEYGVRMYEVTDYVGWITAWRDWGMIGLSWIIGIPAVICLIIPCFIIMRLSINSPSWLYVFYFYLAVMLCSFTNVIFYRNGSFFFHGLLFYIFELLVSNSYFKRPVKM